MTPILCSIEQAAAYVEKTDRHLRDQPYFDGLIPFAARACARRAGVTVARQIMSGMPEKETSLLVAFLARQITTGLIEHDAWMRTRATGATPAIGLERAMVTAAAVTGLHLARITSCAFQPTILWEEMTTDPLLASQHTPSGSIASLICGMQTDDRDELHASGCAALIHVADAAMATPYGEQNASEHPMSFTCQIPKGMWIYVAEAEQLTTVTMMPDRSIPTVGDHCATVRAARTSQGNALPAWPIAACWDTVIRTGTIMGDMP